MQKHKIIASLLFASISFPIYADTSLSRNQTPQVAEHNWHERIRASGLILGELIYSNYNQTKVGRFTEKNPYSTYCFPRANLIIDGYLDTWVQGHMSFNFRNSCGFGSKNDEWAFSKFGTTDEAYITMQQADTTPFYGRVGVQYLPYGHYKRHHIPATLTQLLTQTQTTGIVAGYAPGHTWNAAFFSFTGKARQGKATFINNFGLQLSYDYHQNDDVDVLFNMDYMYNIAGAVNYLVHEGNTVNPNPLNSNYRKRIGGISLSAIGAYHEWDWTAQYTQALSHFDVSDLAYKGDGAKPGAWILEGGYHFTSFNRKSRVSGSYQHSFESVNVRGLAQERGLPKHRWQADYEIDIWRNAHLGGHLIWDRDYTESQGGKGRSSLTTMISLAIYL